MVLASDNSKCSCIAWHCVGWGWPGKTVILSLESLEILCKSILRTPPLLCNVCIYLSLDGNYMYISKTTEKQLESGVVKTCIFISKFA